MVSEKQWGGGESRVLLAPSLQESVTHLWLSDSCRWWSACLLWITSVSEGMEKWRNFKVALFSLAKQRTKISICPLWWLRRLDLRKEKSWVKNNIRARMSWPKVVMDVFLLEMGEDSFTLTAVSSGMAWQSIMGTRSQQDGAYKRGCKTILSIANAT